MRVLASFEGLAPIIAAGSGEFAGLTGVGYSTTTATTATTTIFGIAGVTLSNLGGETLTVQI